MTHEAEIRVATPDDAEAVAAFQAKLDAEALSTLFESKEFPSVQQQTETLRDFSERDDRTCLLAIRDGEVVGHLNLIAGSHPQINHVAMLGMSVLDSNRGSGLGSRLIRAGLDWASAAGLRKIQLEVMSNNPRAVALYERLGFVIEGSRREVVRVGDAYIDMIQMGRALPWRSRDPNNRDAEGAQPSVEASVNLNEKLAGFDEFYQPRIIADFNGHAVMVVKASGAFVWHSHADTDDFFFVLKGRMTIHLRDRDISLGPGDLYVVPRGLEHCPEAHEETHVLLIEPAGTPNTGDVKTAAPIVRA